MQGVQLHVINKQVGLTPIINQNRNESQTLHNYTLVQSDGVYELRVMTGARRPSHRDGGNRNVDYVLYVYVYMNRTPL